METAAQQKEKPHLHIVNTNRQTEKLLEELKRNQPVTDMFLHRPSSFKHASVQNSSRKNVVFKFLLRVKKKKKKCPCGRKTKHQRQQKLPINQPTKTYVIVEDFPFCLSSFVAR